MREIEPLIQIQLEAMANDPEIHRELNEIANEFKITELDGLNED